MADPFNVKIKDGKVRCPDCGAEVNLVITLGPSERVGNEYVVPVSFDEDKFMRDMTAHIKLNPEIHPSFVAAC